MKQTLAILVLYWSSVKSVFREISKMNFKMALIYFKLYFFKSFFYPGNFLHLKFFQCSKLFIVWNIFVKILISVSFCPIFFTFWTIFYVKNSINFNLSILTLKITRLINVTLIFHACTSYACGVHAWKNAVTLRKRIGTLLIRHPSVAVFLCRIIEYGKAVQSNLVNPYSIKK